MNKFIEMPGTNDLINVDHIVCISRLEEDEYLVVLTSCSVTLTRKQYLDLLDIIMA